MRRVLVGDSMHSAAIRAALANLEGVRIADEERVIALSNPSMDDVVEKIYREMERREANELDFGTWQNKGSSHQTRTGEHYDKRRKAAKAARKARKKNRK